MIKYIDILLFYLFQSQKYEMMLGYGSIIIKNTETLLSVLTSTYLRQ